MVLPDPRSPPEDQPAVSAIAVAATVLWQRFLHFDAADPGWADRDRFVLSSGRFRPLLDGLLHEAGVEPPAPDCAWGAHPAMETAAGPPGQGFATAVGMAMAERMLAGRFGRTLVDHRTWVLACETDLAAGVSLEAASLAGRMALDKLAVLFEPSGAGQQDGPDAATRFAACGWAVRSIDATDPEAVAGAIARALRNRRPTLIACNPGGAAAADRFGWSAGLQRGATARRAWLRRLARHRLQGEFARQLSGALPAGWHRTMMRAQEEAADATGTLAAGRQDLAALCAQVPEAVTLHSVAGLAIASALTNAGANGATGSGSVPVAFPSGLSGRHLACGVQEHGMAALANGLSLHGGSRPILGASVISIDRMRPALRLAAAMGRPVVYLLADESLDQSIEQAGWPPMEQLASLRAMPRTALFRPADPDELAACWALALARDDGPSLIAMDRHPTPPRPGPEPSWRHDGCAQGGYVLAEAVGARRATLIATGPEVATALAARTLLSQQGIDTAVVSMPCWELFAARPPAYHAKVLGDAPRIGIEAASGFGWERWLGRDGIFIGMDGFGPNLHSAVPTGIAAPLGPAGITAERISTRIARLLGARP